MNILIIGNGFDLAHGLPTTYVDFLEFSKRINPIYFFLSKSSRWEIFKKDHLDNWDMNQEIKDVILDAYKNRKNSRSKDPEGNWIDNITTQNPFLDEFYSLTKDNLWFEYFNQRDMHGKENWIDFESEISDAIKSLDKDMHGFNKDGNIYDMVGDLSNLFFKRKFYKNFHKKSVTFKELRDDLIQDLDRLIRAFEIYLTEIVEKIDIRVISPDIEKIVAQDKVGSMLFSNVLNFNYTNTYEKIYLNRYGVDSSKYLNYIHGKADINNSIESNNMVLGIDEYLPKKKRNKEIEFIAFKKYYQRIHKQTGCKYKDWLDIINKNNIRMQKNEIENNLYIFGHSLDVTDKDVLKEMILIDNMHTEIYYRNKDQLGQQISNLVKVIGQKELIRRTGGEVATIKFIPQQEMKWKEEY